MLIEIDENELDSMIESADTIFHYGTTHEVQESQSELLKFLVKVKNSPRVEIALRTEDVKC